MLEPIVESNVTGRRLALSGTVATRTTVVSIAVNTSLSLVQVLAGVWSHSQALIADGLHSLSDVIADVVVLFASHEGRKDADAEHPYGHQRFETAASLALGLLLVVVGFGMVRAAVLRLATPETIATVHTLALAIAVLALTCKELLFRYMLAAAKRVRSSLLVANAWHARSDAASSLVVAVGIVGNLAGVPLFDPIAALVVGLMLVRTGGLFAWNALNDLMDRAVDAEELGAIRQCALETPGVVGVHDLRTRKMGDMIVVDIHLEVDADITVEAGHAIAVEAERRLRERYRVLSVMTHVDPAHRPDADHLHELGAPPARG